MEQPDVLISDTDHLFSRGPLTWRSSLLRRNHSPSYYILYLSARSVFLSSNPTLRGKAYLF
jgi:hypothetical protein